LCAFAIAAAGALGLAACLTGNVADDDDDDDDGIVDAGDPDAKDCDASAPDSDASGTSDGGDTPDADPDAPDAEPGAPDAEPDVPDAEPGAPDAPPPDDELEVCAAGGDYSTIAAAIAAVPAGGLVEVCPGVYHEHLTITKRVRLLGTGGAGATFIDASSTGTAIRIDGVTGDGVTIEGFTIRNGSTTGQGGGVRCASSMLHLLDSAVSSNHAISGGGLFASSCGLDVQGTSFTGNTASMQGGGALAQECTGEFRNSVFENNQAVQGGGLAIIEGGACLRESTVTSNTAGLNGGGLYHASDAAVEDNTIADNDAGWTGGGVFVHLHAPELRRNDITGNTSENDGGGLYFHKSSGVLADNTIAANASGDDGGGIRIFESEMRVERNLIQANDAADGGGGIRISHLPTEFYDNEILDNTAVGAGGGIDLDNDSSVVSGGIIAGNTAGRGGGIHGSMFPWFGATLTDIEITDNWGWRGGGIHLEDNFQHTEMRRLTITNNVAGHGAGIYIRTSSFTLSHSVIAGNWTSNEGGALVVGGSGSTWSDECPCPPEQATGVIDFIVAYDNAADEGASGLWVRSPSLSVTNSIWFANTGTVVIAEPIDEMSTTAVEPVWTYNDTSPASFVGMNDPTGSNGNLSADPAFVDAPAGDFHLSPASACIDAGHPAVDDSDGTRADMGRFGGPTGTP
jgi:hypothetical protein